MADNPITWLVLLACAAYGVYLLFRAVILDLEARKVASRSEWERLEAARMEADWREFYMSEEAKRVENRSKNAEFFLF